MTTPTSDPLAAELRDERLYGRGTCDMKGGVAAMVFATEMLGELTGSGRTAVAGLINLAMMFVAASLFHRGGSTVIVDIDVYTRGTFRTTDVNDVQKWIVEAHSCEKEAFFSILGEENTERLREK